MGGLVGAVPLRPSVPVCCPVVPVPVVSLLVPELVPVCQLCFWVSCSCRQKSSAAAAVETFHLVAFSSWFKWDPERGQISAFKL